MTKQAHANNQPAHDRSVNGIHILVPNRIIRRIAVLNKDMSGTLYGNQAKPLFIDRADTCNDFEYGARRLSHLSRMIQ